MAFEDKGHRPHADHRGEKPTTGIDFGPNNITVKLDTWGPTDFLEPMWAYLQSNWGDAPADPASAESRYVHAAFEGRTLQQVLEGISFWFTIDGVTRAATHQLVRSRFAAFMQHGGRDNDWRHRRFTIPETVYRATELMDDGDLLGFRHCIQDPEPIRKYLSALPPHESGMRLGLMDAILGHLGQAKELYAALVDAGIPWQDARRFLGIGHQTYLHGIYNYVSLRDVLNNRLEFVMDWEINCVAQLMLREVRMQCPPIVANSLMSRSDREGRAAFAGLESWPPDGKYPVPDEFRNLHRTHRPEQNPFWVLARTSMDGGPIQWIPTDGVYPHDDPEAPEPVRR
jgi:thymidylate synthase ThyX